MKLNVLADTISTYLTLFSALLLPVVMLVWVRSYLVSDRFYRAEEGRAVVAMCSNGELSLWRAPTAPHLNLYEHRSRQTSWGWSNRRVFQRVAAKEHFWLLGFGYAEGPAIPWRGIPVNGRAVGVVVPLWFLGLVTGVMPFRLLARNMQTSQEFLAQRAAESAEVTT